MPSRPAARISPIDAGAADDRHVVADGAAGAVECRSQTFLRCLHFEEVVQPEPEFFELAWRDAGQRLAKARACCASSIVSRAANTAASNDGCGHEQSSSSPPSLVVR